ncbi:MFS transporter [Solihabitans fulvus]|uniref:MFS transporter n=1 Tax=Solihabitans fulvus TaxID=1892852 RepID=A0A5B2XUW3_9PSEU|nr:MFS transporter [Solihabitans fulvus]KAA2266541.1 MFS transporter [Solihabitans fulvus]
MTQTAAAPRLSPAYWRLWCATGIDSVGNGVFTAAVPLLAVTITRDPRLVSLVSTAAYLPWLLLSLPTGSLVDRHDRVALMWRSQAIQAVIVGALAAMAAIGAVGIPALAVVAFGLGACDVVFGNAAQATLPDLVSKPLLHRANGNQQTITVVGQQFAGPPAGGVLFALAAALPFGVDAASFVLSAVLLATLPRRSPRRDAQVRGRVAVVDGLRWLGRHRLLRTLAVLLGVNTFCGQLANVTLVLLATQELRLDTRGYGLLLTGAALGSVIGGLVNARVVGRIGALPALLTALATNVVAFVGIGLSPNAVALGAFLAVNGFATTLWNIVTVSVRQQLVPPSLLGRVTSVYKMLGWGLIPLGALTGGLLAHGFGLRAPYPVAGVLRGIALLAALPVLVPAMRAQALTLSRSSRPVGGPRDDGDDRGQQLKDGGEADRHTVRLVEAEHEVELGAEAHRAPQRLEGDGQHREQHAEGGQNPGDACDAGEHVHPKPPQQGGGDERLDHIQPCHARRREVPLGVGDVEDREPHQ